MDSQVTQTESYGHARRVPGHLARIRLLKGHSQASLARASHCGRSTIARVERGNAPRIETAIRIARALDEPVAACFPELAL